MIDNGIRKFRLFVIQLCYKFSLCKFNCFFSLSSYIRKTIQETKSSRQIEETKETLLDFIFIQNAHAM